MNFDEILAKVNLIFREVLDEDELEVKAETTADDVGEWDSLTHIQLIVEIEIGFKIRFTSLEIQVWKNVGDMCKSIEARLNS